MAKRFLLHDLTNITNNFADGNKIGSGGFANVYRAFYNGKPIAVKVLDTRSGFDNQQFMNELDNHMKAKHTNIVQLVGYCYEESNEHITLDDGRPVFAARITRVLCFEFMHGGSLDRRISENSLGDSWNTHYKIIMGICDGLLHLHCGSKRPILHLDLKPANILLDKSMVPKLADFGLSQIYNASCSHIKVDTVAGTTRYMAPELKDGSNMLSKMADIFSLGVTIIEIIKGSQGFGDYYYDLKREAIKFTEAVREYWIGKDGTAPLNQVEICTEIAIRCVDPDRRKRPTIEEIVAKLQETKTLSQDLQEDLALDSSASPVKLPSSSSSGRGEVDVVIVYAFDCSTSTSAWYAVDDGVFWMVHEKLTHLGESCMMGYIYFMSSNNTYTSDMKPVEAAETKATGYTGFARRRMTCLKKMASGLAEAHKMITEQRYENGMILLFSDGLIHKGDFFDGADNFSSKVPVHTFTLGGTANNQGLRAISSRSPGGEFHTVPVPERPSLSAHFSKLLDRILGVTTSSDFEKPPGPMPISARKPLDVVIVYAFDCTDYTPAWYTVNDWVFWLVQEKLTHFEYSCLGYIYPMLTPNTYTSDMKLVDAAETKATGYTGFAWRKMPCTKNMASGLPEAHRMISNRGYQNGVILLFSDGMVNNKGDFFDGAEEFDSTVPVHTFTLGGDANHQSLKAIATNSPGGKFHTAPVPERPHPHLSAHFSQLLDGILSGAMMD